MSGWESYRPWIAGALIREVRVASTQSEGLQAVLVRLYANGVEVVFDDAAPPDRGDADRTAPPWVLQDDLGTRYERRGGSVSGNRDKRRERHAVLFAHAVPPNATRIKLTGEGRTVTLMLDH